MLEKCGPSCASWELKSERYTIEYKVLKQLSLFFYYFARIINARMTMFLYDYDPDGKAPYLLLVTRSNLNL